MKLSEAIRLGAAMKPQSFTGYRNDAGTRTCALGAAMEAIGRLPEEWNRASFPEAIHIIALCPVRRCSWQDSNSLDDIVIHLNDDHHWKRERIADWVELQEPVPVMAPEPEKEVMSSMT